MPAGNYNKHTPGTIKRIGCSQCGQKGGRHAAYCPFNPTCQEAVAKQLAKSQNELRFIDLWQAIKSIQQRLGVLESK